MRHKTDANQVQIVKDLRKLGMSVFVTSHTKGGYPDIVVGYRGRNFLFEIKDPTKPPSARRLTFMQERFFKEWVGQVDVIETTEDALKIIYGAFSDLP